MSEKEKEEAVQYDDPEEEVKGNWEKKVGAAGLTMPRSTCPK